MTAAELLKAMLNGRIRLEVDIASGRDDVATPFRTEYRKRTGGNPSDGFNRPDSKRTRQFRIYCNIDGYAIDGLRRAGINVTPNRQYRPIYNARFTLNEEQFWELIDIGFRVGDN